MQCRDTLLLQGGHLGFDNALCGVGGVAGCQKKRYAGHFFLFTSNPHFALGPFALMILILDSDVWSPFRNLDASIGQWIPLGGLSDLFGQLHTCLTCSKQ